MKNPVTVSIPAFRRITGVIFSLVALALTPAVFGAQITWLGNNSTDIRAANNWVGGVAPVANTDSMLFNAAGTAGTSLVNPVSGNNTQFVGSFATGQGAIQFSSTAPSYTFSGFDLRLGDGGIWNASSGTVQTFNNLLRLNTTNSFNFDANNAQTVVNGSLDLSQGVGTRSVSVSFRNSTGGVLFFNGDIINSNATPGTGSLTLTANASSNATGTVVLGGNNASLNGTITVANVAGTSTGVTLTNTGAIRNLASIATGNVNALGRLRYNAGAAMTYNGTAPVLNMGGVASAPTLDINLDGANQQFSSAALNQKGTVVLSTTSASNQTLTITGATTFGVATGNQSAFLTPLGGASLSLNGVSTLPGSAPTQAHTLVLSGTSQNNEINGVIAGSTNSTVVLAKIGASTWTLRGNNTFSGAAATTVLAGGTLGLDYSTNNTSKLANDAVLDLRGGTLNLSGGNHTEVVLSTTLTLGGSQIARSSGSATIALGALTQTSGALNIGGNAIATTTTANVNGRLGGFSRITVGSGSNYSFAKNDGANNIVGMADSDYTALAPTSGSNAIVYNLDGSLTYTGATTTIGSLRIRTTGAGQSLTINGTNAMAIGNSTTGAGAGAILFTGADDYTIVNNSTGNALRASTGALLIHQWGAGNLTITGTGNTTTGVILSSQIDKFGSGRLIITGNNSNTSTTATTIGGGILQVASNAALGNQTTGGAISLQGGTFVGDTTGGSFALNNGGSNSRNVTVGLTGGGIDVIGGNALTVSGVISSSVIGSGTSTSSPLTLGSATTNGTIILSGANNYTGGTILRGGTVEIQNASALGLYALGNASGGQISNYIQFTGGTLRYGTGTTTDLAQRIRYSTSAVNIDTNGQSVTFSNEIDYTNIAGLTKLGAGTLTLNGTNTYSGTTTVTAGTLAFGENNRLLSTGAVTVNGGDLAVGTTTQTVGAVTLSSGNITGTTGRLIGSSYAVHSGNISATLAGNGSLSKSTGGTVILTGNNTFTGATLVSGGTLQAAAANALGATSSVTVNTGGTLWLTANNTVNDTAAVSLGGGTILKGPAATGETFGALALTADSSLSFGTVAGTLNFGSYTGNGFKLNVSNFQEGSILTFRTDLSSSIENTSLFGFDNAFSYAWDSGSTTFTITAIPEPSAVAAAVAFLGLAAWRGVRRRRGNKVSQI